MSAQRRDRTGLWIGAVIGLIIVGLMFASFGWSRLTEKTEMFTVTRVGDQVVSSTDSHGHTTVKRQLLVYTNHGTYKDTDSPWFLKFNSADLAGQMQDGHTYRCQTSGFRLGFTSSYRNLIHCSEVPR